MTPDPGAIDFTKAVRLDAVSAGDFEELVALRIAAMRESLEKVGRFSPERARERLAKSFYPEHTRFIRLDERAVGFLTFRPSAEGFQLDHLYLHPDFQSSGIGSYVLRSLIATAHGAGAAIHLGALKLSRSNAFYERHGFQKVNENEWDNYYVLPPGKLERAAPGRGAGTV